ncbi:MAG: aminotransferase class [Caulobacteraceae bacterium]|nr:aminotransferase class [Caulobacteraceae bacterium]
MIYLDYNATAPIRSAAKAAVLATMDETGNPSSVHAAGRAARSRVETARAQVAALVGVRPGSITFTGGGTEANALAIHSAKAAGFERIIVSAGEHDSVLEAARMSGMAMALWPVRADGTADLDWLGSSLASGGRTLVCLSLANNETGIIQPMVEVSQMVWAVEGWLHVDAVQAAGKISVDFNRLGADSMSLSAHKIGGPQGVGALAAGPRATLSRLQHGGGQERGRRAGTENVAGIAGFGAAANEALAGLDSLAAQAAWRDDAASLCRAAGAVVIGEGSERLPQTLSIAAMGFGSELQVMALDLAGVMASAGAACSSGKVKASRVIEAMGRADLAPFGLRLSGGWASTREDWLAAARAWIEAYGRLDRKVA